MGKVTRNPKNSQDRPLPGWVWLLTGIALGLIVAFFVYLDSQRSLRESRSVAFDTPTEKQSNAEQDHSLPTKRKFDFYTLLPELEVLVPESSNQEPSPSALPEVPPVSGTQPENKEAKVSVPTAAFLLQVGSFQKYAEADSLKAQLALLGVEADIQTVKVNNKSWHRVRIGPYRDRQRLNQIRAKLRRNNIDSMLMMARQ